MGHVPVISPYHAGTETMYGFNIELNSTYCSYVALTTLNFFEFIPEEEIDKEIPTTVLAHEVKLGYSLSAIPWLNIY